MLKHSALFCVFIALLVACSDGAGTVAPGADARGRQNPPPRPITDPAPPPASDAAPRPAITKVEPASVALGSVGPTVVLTGTGFAPRTTVRVDGDEITTTFLSETELSATLPTNKVGTVGVRKLEARTPAPGGGTSDAVDFAVENPPPTLIALDPLSIVAGSGNTRIRVVGVTFVPDSKIVFGSTELATTFVDAEHLEATLPGAELDVSKSVPVTVKTPEPGGGSTTQIAFVVSNPGSTISSIEPPTVRLNAADFTLKVKGTGFVAGSKILFNGAALTTTLGGPGELTATVRTNDVSSAGDKTVAVQNPPPGGGLSAAVNLVVNNPVPTTTAIDKSFVAAGTATPFPVVITGTGFVSTSKVMAKIGAAAAVPLTTQVVSATQIKGTFQAPNMSKVAAVLLTVKTDAPGGGESTPAIKFSVQPGVPKITSLDPAKIPVASNDTPVTIKGTGFLANSAVTVDGQSLPATLAGANLVVTVPATLLTSLGSRPVIVSNPPDASLGGGGGPSAPSPLVVGCDESNVNVILADTVTETTLENNFAAAPLLTRWASEGQCPNVPLASPATAKQPGRYAVVVNAMSAPITLSAWAACDEGANGAAFLTFYERPTPPPSDAERLQCSGFVAQSAPHLSPEAGGSARCPGLTKANGGGITLNACEKAVVHIQTFDRTSATFTAPPFLKIKADP